MLSGEFTVNEAIEPQVGVASEEIGQVIGDSRTEYRFALGHCPNASEHFRFVWSFAHLTPGPGSHGGE